MHGFQSLLVLLVLDLYRHQCSSSNPQWIYGNGRCVFLPIHAIHQHPSTLCLRGGADSAGTVSESGRWADHRTDSGENEEKAATESDSRDHSVELVNMGSVMPAGIAAMAKGLQKSKDKQASDMHDRSEPPILEENAAAPELMSMEDLGELDDDQSFVNVHEILKNWHEMLRERQRNPDPLQELRQHPNWYFIQEVQTMLEAGEKHVNESKAASQRWDKEILADPLVQTLQRLYPRNFSNNEDWTETEMEAAVEVMQQEEAAATAKEKGPYHLADKDTLNAAMPEAARKGDVTFLDGLLRSGADPDKLGDQGWTPLLWAVHFRQHQAIRVLVQYGAGLEVMGAGGETALMQAATIGDSEGIRVLHALGASLHTTDNEGRTAVHYAAAFGHVDPALLLTDLGADVSAVDANGNKAADLAEDDDPELAAALRAREAAAADDDGGL